MSRSGQPSRSRLGDAALADLVANRRRFLDFVAARVGNGADAEELLQDAFARGIERGGTVREDESVVAWFYRLLRNAVVDYYRHRAAERRALERQPRDLVADPEFEAELEDAACRCVLSALDDLKPEYAGLLREVDVGGHSVTRAAGKAGLTPGNARVRLHRARQALREQVRLICRTCAEHGCLDCTCQSGRL